MDDPINRNDPKGLQDVSTYRFSDVDTAAVNATNTIWNEHGDEGVEYLACIYPTGNGNYGYNLTPGSPYEVFIDCPNDTVAIAHNHVGPPPEASTPLPGAMPGNRNRSLNFSQDDRLAGNDFLVYLDNWERDLLKLDIKQGEIFLYDRDSNIFSHVTDEWLKHVHGDGE